MTIAFRRISLYGWAIVSGLVWSAGCGRGPVDEARIDVPVRVTASADPSRPVAVAMPEVITKPRPFRLPDVIGAVPSLEPLTMTPSPGIAVVTRSEPDVPPLEFPSDRPAVAEVAAMLSGYLQAFNRHDAAALAAHWSPTAENVDLDSGDTTRGRAAVEAVFATLFEEDAEATIDIDVESIRPLRDDVAVVDGVSRIAFTETGSAAPHGAAASSGVAGSRFSAVVVKRDGRWLLESVREASIAAPAA
ncbi:MAG: SgcJ/EcaC family oxidoreductase, partial [Planctomycetia bacterium]|nr:SgcJ/EcaC family oxidoreductase [Planctomycetia bacterium]